MYGGHNENVSNDIICLGESPSGALGMEKSRPQSDDICRKSRFQRRSESFGSYGGGRKLQYGSAWPFDSSFMRAAQSAKERGGAIDDERDMSPPPLVKPTRSISINSGSSWTSSSSVGSSDEQPSMQRLSLTNERAMQWFNQRRERRSSMPSLSAKPAAMGASLEDGPVRARCASTRTGADLSGMGKTRPAKDPEYERMFQGQLMFD